MKTTSIKKNIIIDQKNKTSTHAETEINKNSNFDTKKSHSIFKELRFQYYNAFSITLQNKNVIVYIF